MSCTALIRSSEPNFKLSQKILESLAAKFNFTVEEGWGVICDSNIDYLTRKFRRERRKNNPYNQIKKPRTAFSFFTKDQRQLIATKNPKASFGELSKLVSVEWRALSDSDRKKYKNKELKDKTRYQEERQVITLQLENANQEETTPTTTTTVTPSTTSSKSKRGKNTTSGKSKGSGKSTTTSTTTTTSKSTPTPTPTPTTSSKKSSKGGSSSYTLFQRHQRPLIKQEFPDLSPKEVNSRLGEVWRGYTLEQKAVYASS